MSDDPWENGESHEIVITFNGEEMFVTVDCVEKHRQRVDEHTTIYFYVDTPTGRYELPISQSIIF